MIRIPVATYLLCDVLKIVMSIDGFICMRTLHIQASQIKNSSIWNRDVWKTEMDIQKTVEPNQLLQNKIFTSCN